MRIIAFDPEKHFLGRLCKYGHDYQNTSQSARYICSGECVVCILERQERYRDTPKRKEVVLRYCHSPKGQETRRRYQQSPERQAAMRRYENSPEGKDTRRRYFQSPKGKEVQRRCESSAKMQQVRRRYRSSQRGKEVKRLGVARYNARKRNNLVIPYTPDDIQKIKEFFDTCCAYCGVPLQTDCQIDHVVPIAKGGADAIFNLVPACPRCNNSKNDRLLDEWYCKQEFFSLERLIRIQELTNGQNNAGASSEEN